jgi:hypothetical protein
VTIGLSKSSQSKIFLESSQELFYNIGYGAGRNVTSKCRHVTPVKEGVENEALVSLV